MKSVIAFSCSTAMVLDSGGSAAALPRAARALPLQAQATTKLLISPSRPRQAADDDDLHEITSR
jgi:hypothetical protein